MDQISIFKNSYIQVTRYITVPLGVLLACQVLAGWLTRKDR